MKLPKDKPQQPTTSIRFEDKTRDQIEWLGRRLALSSLAAVVKYAVNRVAKSEGWNK